MPPSPSPKTFTLHPSALTAVLFLLALLPRAILGWYFPQFNGDIARDAYVLKDVLSGQLVLVGPHISRVGDVFPHLGPLLYYVMLPFLYLSRFQLPQLGNIPVVVLDSLASVLLFRLICRRYGTPLGLMAWMFYAISANNVFWGSFSWNGNYGPAMVIICSFLIENLAMPEVPGNREEVRSKKKTRFLLALCLVSLTHMHLMFWCFVLPGLVLTIKNKLGIWKIFLLLGSVSLLPLLLAEVQSGWANTQAFITSQQVLPANWPFHNLLYLYQTVMASFFWQDKMHRDLNAINPGWNVFFLSSLLFVVLTAAGLIILLRRKKKDIVLLCLPAIALLLLFPARLNAERYWLFVTLPLGITALSALIAVLWRQRTGILAVYVLLAVFLGYNIPVTRQLLKDVSADRYQINSTVMVSIQETRRRSEALLAGSEQRTVAILASTEAAQMNRAFIPLRYFAELSGKRIIAAPLDPGRAFDPAYFYPRLKTENQCRSGSGPVDVLWMHTLDEDPPLSAPLGTADIYWATFEGKDYYGRSLGILPCSEARSMLILPTAD